MTEPQAVAGPGATRCTLPADQAVFVGRDKELQQIVNAAADAARHGGVIAIHAIDGMPGIGKTALAVHVAHMLKDRFGDRQLFIDLHAHTPGQAPVQPDDALTQLLAADGIDPRFLPATVDGRAALWRDRTADKRLLLVLDNAASSQQVAPLLPGSASSLVLVTSRRSLGDIPSAVPLPLDILTPDEAITMFMRLAPHAATNRDAMAELVRACGYLPLAVSITASLFLRHRSWTLGDLLREVRGSGGPLTFTAENRTVAAVFDLSYQNLHANRQRLFRLLGLHPGIDIDPYAAAALAGIPLEEAQQHLDGLYADHLLDEPVYRRYRMHDLIRAHANTLTITVDPANVRQEAIGRLLGFYQHTAICADTHLARYPRTASAVAAAPLAAPEFTTWEQAEAWLRAEQANLLACIHHTTTTGQHAHTVALTAGIAGLLRADGPWTQAIQLHDAAAAAARQLGDQHAEADALHDLGAARRLTGDYPAAAELCQKALDLYRALGDRLGQAHALNELGIVRRLTGDYPAAAELCQRALDLYRVLGDRRGHATAVHNLGTVRWLTGDYPAAADLLGQALELHQAVGYHRGQANTLNELGIVRSLTGNYPAAADLLSQALELHQAVGNRLGQANTLKELGSVRWLTGDYPAAADLLSQALELHQGVGNRLGQANTVDELGMARRLMGDYSAAARLHRQAIELHRSLGRKHGEAIASTRLAAVTYLTGKYTEAAHLLHEALAVFREVGAPDDEAEALNHLATLHRLTGDPDHAYELYQQALVIARRIHHRLEEAHALEGLGRAALDLGDTSIAALHLGHALDLYQQLGVPDATQVTIDLAILLPYEPVSPTPI
ncbi:tetratricopeptide repeat protein [Allorhizocola rhizosphaerae]|uniref:tetratricopeptide repeat protein n=1 Tax=Allorhizocola rhizosphaerae TaxID=1872709 RepID=UPI0013C366BF|nr:tetratricopeptide repeat protein [Allorhizocola rhizosphaerae]